MGTQGDFVENALGATETTETNLGTITLPPTGVSRIVGIWCIINAVQTTAEYVSGYFRLAGSSIAGIFKFPANAIAAGAGVLAGGGFSSEPKIIPVNIPVPANEKITLYVATWLAQTGGVRAAAGIIWE